VEWYYSLALMLGTVFVLMALSLPVAFAFFVTNIVGALIFLGGGAGIETFIRGSMFSISTFSLAPIPFFLVIGEILLRTGLAFRAVNAIDQVIRRVPGRLSVVAVTGGTFFSALSGSTVATTAMLGQALVPDMLRRGYHPTMAMGPIIAVGGVDMLIPPSNLAVIFATIASSVSIVKISIAELLVAGILPGLIMSALFITYIIVRCWWSPHLAPPALKEADMLHGWARWKPLLVSVAPLMSIFFVMIGSIFMGWASPTDSAALGCLATVVLAGCYRVLTVSAVIGALKNSAIVTTMIFFIVAASTTFAQILAISGATDGALGQLLKFNLTPLGAVLCMVGVLIFLGCFMEQIAMMLLTLPFFIPLANSLHIDMLWLSIVLLISLQIGLIHPPFGLLLFVMRGVAPPEITVRQIWMSIIPFVIMVFAVLFLIIFVPWIATGVARLM
jgi:tripartite ATP-independent transporter DctM subunit